MSFTIHGLGTAQPAHAIEQRHMAAAAEPCCCANDRQRKLLPTLYRRTTVARRNSVVLNATKTSEAEQADPPMDQRMLDFYPPAAHDADRGPTLSQRMKRYPEEALALAADACRKALAEADVRPDQVGQLVVVSCTGFSAPGVDIGLIDVLGLPATVGRTVVGFMGCHGAMNGLRIAGALADSQVAEKTDEYPGADGFVLMCCVELCTLHFQYGWDPQKVVANALFADGAAAVIGRPAPTPGNSETTSIPHPHFPRVVAHGSYLLPEARDLMTWLIRDHGFEMTLSPRVPGLIRQTLPGWVTPWLAQQGFTIEQIRGWAIHPGGPRVIAAVEESLDLFPGAGDPSRKVLRDCGNMSSPTVLFILDRLRQSQTPRPWVAIAFGPGLTIEAALLA